VLANHIPLASSLGEQTGSRAFGEYPQESGRLGVEHVVQGGIDVSKGSDGGLREGNIPLQ
jgi:hypothetical protein